MKPDALIGLALLGVAGYVLYQLFRGNSPNTAFSAATYNDAAGNYQYLPAGALATYGPAGPRQPGDGSSIDLPMPFTTQ